MLYQLVPTFREIRLDEVDPESLTAGALGADALDSLREHFGFSQRSVDDCRTAGDRYRNSIDVYEDYTFCVVTLVNAADSLAPADKVAFFFKRNLFLMVSIVDLDGSAERIFTQAVRRYKPESATLEKIVSTVLESFVDGDGDALAKMEFEISAMEEELAAGKLERAFIADIYELRRQLLKLRTYYEQLIDIGEELQENENDVFSDDAMRYIAMFTGRAARLSTSVQQMRDSLAQLREAYQAAMDYNLNRVIKILTVLATVYLPPTLIAGWYGMNFKHMPELDWTWGYPLVIGLSLAIVVASLIYFRRKRMW